MTGLRRWVVGVMIAGMGFVQPQAGWAEETSELKAEVAALRERLQQLEQRLAVQEAKVVAPPSAPAGLPAIAEGIRMSGFVDASYVYNFNKPERRANTLRVFDTGANGFQPHGFEIAVEKPVSEDSRVGFRADLFVGEDAEVFGAAGLGSTTDEIDLQQAYAEALLPVGNGLNAKFGKFVTAHGAEVIESKDNWNFSRSFLFGYAIPFTHTGARFTYPWLSWLTTFLGVNNGWDKGDDKHTAKSIEWGGLLTPTPKTSASIIGMVGPERASDNRDDRTLVDVVLGYNPTDQLSLKLNYDFGYEEDAVSEFKNSQWQGVAAYARYQWNDWYATAVRGEYFLDYGGARTGSLATDLRLWELTFTNEFKVYKDLITRLEYRHDFASEPVFAEHEGTDNEQNTVAVE